MLAILCSVADPSIPHERDPAHASDTTPPSATIVTSAELRRSSDSGCMNCGVDRSMISIALAATDDATPADRIGYKLTVVGGDPPKGLAQTQTLQGGSDLLLFVDPNDRAFSFDLE